jgi:PAS domain S-box-containing protein
MASKTKENSDSPNSVSRNKVSRRGSNHNGGRLLSTVRNAPIGIAECSLEGMYINVNEEFCRITGFTKEEVLTHTIKDISYEQDYAGEMRLHEQLLAGEIASYRIEKRYVRKDAAIIWVQVIRSLVRDSDGNAVYSVGIVQDITAKKQAEKELHETKERYHNLFDLVPVAVYACDANGLILEFNQTAVELWGREPEKNNAAERYCGSFRIYYPDGRPMAHGDCPMARMLQGETLQPHELEILVERPDGVYRNVLAHPWPLKNERGEIIQAINCLYDITDRKQIEEALQLLTLQLESRVQDRTKDLNTAIVALHKEVAERRLAERSLLESGQRLHELSRRLVEAQEDERRALARELHDRAGQTLSALNINLTTIHSQLAGESRDQFGGRIEDSLQLVAEAIALVRNVMADLRPAEIDAYGLVSALKSHISAYMSRYPIRVIFDHADEPMPRLGSGIETMVLRITQEAMTNVARHAHADQIIVSLRREENALKVTIQDNGTGIPAMQESMRPGSHGLTFMRERVEAVGGGFQIFSTTETGTRIEVTVNLGNEDPTAQLIDSRERNKLSILRSA